MLGRIGAAVFAAVMVGSLTAASPAAAANVGDAGSRTDAGDTFDSAMRIAPRGYYSGSLDGEADRHDFYKFFLREGAAVSVLFTFGAPDVDPVTLLDPSGNLVDAGTRVASQGVSASAALTSEFPAVRLAVHRALVPGEYRLHVQSERFALGDYALCFMNCEQPVMAPMEFAFGGSLRSTRTKVLLVPPSHGDLGNPFGPTVEDYMGATLRGIRKWTRALDRFANDHPRYSYLRAIEIEIEIFDGIHPVDPVAFDIVVGYVASGPAFRGVAVDADAQSRIESVLDQAGLDDDVRFTGRAIALSLFASSPRAGQVLYDFPEVNDLENVTAHEFGHTFGLGHTRTWHRALGPDLMNSPAPWVYGDGFPAGDGGERTPLKCFSSLNLYAMAKLYRWIPTSKWQATTGKVGLPESIPYRSYC